ncbi:MAG: caspase family protein [Pseudomonadota bacterium]
MYKVAARCVRKKPGNVRLLLLAFLLCHLLSACAPSIINIPLDTENRIDMNQFDLTFKEQDAPKIQAPALIREKPLAFMPGNSIGLFFDKKIYNFPIGDLLERVMNRAVYAVFDKPDPSVSECFGIYVYLDRFQVNYSGLGSDKTATCHITVRVKVREPQGTICIAQKTFLANATSPFTSKRVPQAIWTASALIGNDVIKFLARNQEISRVAKSIVKKHGVVAATAKPESQTPPKLKQNGGTMPTPAHRFEAGQKWAVVAGISRYKHSGNNQITNLRYASRDAQALSEFLKDPKGGGFDHVYELYDEDVTYKALRYALFEYLGQAIEEDMVLVFFAGHGAPDPNNPQNLYLLTYDTDPQKVASTAFPMWDVETALKRNIKAQTVILISDACHSGGISGGVGTRGITVTENKTNESLLKLAYDPGKISFTASEANEKSHESNKWGGGHGVFTHYLLEGLQGQADTNRDRIVTLGEVVDYTSENVRRATRNQQHPDTSGMFDRNLPINILEN